MAKIIDKFGLEFLIGTSPEVPRGFAAARIFLGNFNEGLYTDIRRWNKDNYKNHWKASAKSIVKYSLPTLFCSSFEPVNLDIWLGVPDNKYVTFYNRLVKRKDLLMDGIIINPKEEMSDFIGDTFGISSWTVSIDKINDFYLKS